MSDITKIGLSSEQKRLYDFILNFCRSDNGRYCVISGSAGTGKTYTAVAAALSLSLEKVVGFTALTNKAVKVVFNVAEKLGDILDIDTSYSTFCTLHSMLGLVLTFSEDYQFLSKKGDEKIVDFDVILVDESSMVSSEMLRFIGRVLDVCDTKIIFVGDPYQLPPIDSSPSSENKVQISKVFTHINNLSSFHLSTTVRQSRGNPVLDYSVLLRDYIKESYSKLLGNEDTGSLFETNKSDWIKAIGINNKATSISNKISTIPRPKQNVIKSMGVKRVRAFDIAFVTDKYKHLIKDGDNIDRIRSLAWTNKRVDEMNKLVRRVIFKERARKLYVEGEYLVANSALYDLEEVIDTTELKNPIFKTSDEFLVDHILDEDYLFDCSIIPKNRSGMSKPIRLSTLGIEPIVTTKVEVIHREHGTKHILLMPSEIGIRSLKNALTKISYIAKTQGRDYGGASSVWSLFWKLKSAVSEVSYPYALTVHKSQGSTFKYVVVDVRDILRNIEPLDASRCLYTAVTRPSHGVYYIL